MRCVDGNVDGNTDDQGTICAELCGPVTIDPRDPAFNGAEHLSNNTAEMTALIEALKLLTATDAPFDTSMPTLVRPDSEYAAKIAVGISRPGKNKQLAEEAASLLWKLARSRLVCFGNSQRKCEVESCGWPWCARTVNAVEASGMSTTML